MSETAAEKVIGVVVCDFARAAIGTRSRLSEVIGGMRVLDQVVERLLRVEGLAKVVLLVPGEQMQAQGLQSLALGDEKIKVIELLRRPEGMDARVRAGRQWNLLAWRGGAGQYTVFDEEYHPAAIAGAVAERAADHVLLVHSHGIFLDVALTSALVRHHLHKNHETKMTYTPCAPGLAGIVLRADIAAEMGAKNVLPWQLLGYDPANPTFDTLIREACMQVDPALSKIPNRFCVDTDRGWQQAKRLLECGDIFESAADLALAAARGIAPGVKDLPAAEEQPREVEIELTGQRLTHPPGCVPSLLREARGQLDARHWTAWFECAGATSTTLHENADGAPRHAEASTSNLHAKTCTPRFWDDILLTFGGDGDPLLYPDFPEVLRAAKAAGALAIGVQTDLACTDLTPLMTAIDAGLIDVLGITMYGHTRETYAKVAGADLHHTVMHNLAQLAPAVSARGGVPLVIPRLLKVRDTIPEMEPFFDAWIRQSGWAVIDPPTDRAGGVAFAGVVDMAAPKRKACRRIWDRVLIRANGVAVACDQDMNDQLAMGNIESMTLAELWASARFTSLRQQHADGSWSEINPCQTCREWHRA